MVQNNKGANTGHCSPSCPAGCHREYTKSGHAIHILLRPQNIPCLPRSRSSPTLVSVRGKSRLALGVKDPWIWGGTDTPQGRVSIPKRSCLNQITPFIWPGLGVQYMQGTGCLFLTVYFIACQICSRKRLSDPSHHLLFKLSLTPTSPLKS